jgi:membrane fusion protein
LNNQSSLFRPEALESRKVKWMGEVVLIPPLSFALLTGFAVVMALSVILFFVLGSYTKRSTVIGQLLPSAGQVKVRVPQYGVVLKKFVQEGQFVEKGESLLSISSERYGSDAMPFQAEISRQLRLRRHSLLEEIGKQKLLQLDQRKNLVSKVSSLQGELSILVKQTASQQKMVALAADATSRYSGLMEKGYISMDQLQRRQSELLGQRQSFQSLERERTALQQQLVERRNELSSLDSRQANELANLDRSLSLIDQEVAESESKRMLLITAPEAGIVTAVMAEVGQTLDSTRSVMSIVPTNTKLIAELYAPSKAIGFIKVGDPVLVRYQAYPYQKFGQQRGQIVSISRVTISYAELASMSNSIPGLGNDGEQFYRMQVDLEEQNILTYGKSQLLQSGMLLEADVLQETRRLYEWVLEPLYSLTGKL